MKTESAIPNALWADTSVQPKSVANVPCACNNSGIRDDGPGKASLRRSIQAVREAGEGGTGLREGRPHADCGKLAQGVG